MKKMTFNQISQSAAYRADDVSVSLTVCGGSYGGGSEVLVTYQKVTGCLSQGAHPGSYNGQDAYNDMLVTDESSKYRQRTVAQHQYDGGNEPSGLYARCTSSHGVGGGTDE